MKKSLLFLVIFSFSCKIQLLEQDRTYFASNSKFDKSTLDKSTNANTFYFIRHTEPRKDNKNDLHLSGNGLKKAHLYAKYFMDKKVDTVFTTNLKRTFETAEIIAKKKSVKIIYYDPFAINFKEFLKEHKNSSIVVVGHSNTTPNFVNGILGEPKHSQIEHDNYSEIFRVVIINGKAVFDEVLILEEEVQKIEDAKLSPKELKQVLKERKKAVRVRNKSKKQY